jgi:thioesterase domain-containing protein
VTAPVPKPADATAFIHQAIPMLGRLGLQVVAMGPGTMTLRVPFEGNHNHVGTMYAGALFAIAEVPGGALAVQLFDPAKYYPVIKDMSVDYRRPARTDVTVDASISPEDVERVLSEVDAAGKADFVMDLEVKDAEGTVVMTALGHYQLRAHR